MPVLLCGNGMEDRPGFLLPALEGESPVGRGRLFLFLGGVANHAGDILQHAHAHGLGQLFAGHAPADCQLLDQLNQGGAPAAEWSVPGAAAAPACPPAPAAQPLRPGAPLPFQARAPPVA